MGMLLRRHYKQVKPVEKPDTAVEMEEVKETAEKAEKEPVAEYNKTQINRMAKEELVEVAKANGIENAEEASGASLKKELIQKLGL